MDSAIGGAKPAAPLGDAFLIKIKDFNQEIVSVYQEAPQSSPLANGKTTSGCRTTAGCYAYFASRGGFFDFPALCRYSPLASKFAMAIRLMAMVPISRRTASHIRQFTALHTMSIESILP